MTEKWQKAQEWELNWHESCINSLYEDQKQLIYAEKMSLTRSPTPKTPYNFDLKGKTILDIGAGPYSILLKCVNYKDSCVIDPLLKKFPKWVLDRYRFIGIKTLSMSGEELNASTRKRLFEGKIFDEVWLYNVLEHTYSPKKVVESALELGKIVRIFEWLDTPPNIGHPQTLKEKFLNKWLGGEGRVEVIAREGTTAKCYYGVFKGNNYE